MKLCHQCKWLLIRAGSHNAVPECDRNPYPKRPDYVHGGYLMPQGLHTPVSAQQCRERETGCGPDAKWFEAKL